ncbi:XerC Integrase [Burkholderiaceae bacterium]
MQPQTVNYSIKHIQASVPINTPNLAADVFNWMPGPFKSAKVHIPSKEFNLNKSLFKDHVALNNSNMDNTLPGEFVGIQEVISIILAQEKHKVSRNEVTEGTYRMTKVRLETNIAEFFAFTDLRRINTASIQQFIDFLSDKELSTPTIVGYIAQLRKVLRYLVEKDIIQQMPLFPKMKVTQKPRGAFTVTEYAAVLRQAKVLRNHVFVWNKPDTRFHIKPIYRRMPLEMNWLIRFMVYTFLRPGDIRQLKNKHIEIISGKFNYLRLTPPEIKRHKAPTVSLPQAVNIYKTVLKHHTAQGFGGPEDYVFFPEEKNRLRALNTIGWLFNWIMNSLGLKAGPHGADRSFYSLRHTAITFRLIFGGNIDLLTLARNARTSVEMIEKFYASTLSAEMNIQLLHSKRRS